MCSSAVEKLQANDPAAHADRHGLRAIPRPELVENAAHVTLHGVFGNGQVDADVAVAMTLGELAQDVDLTLAQLLRTHLLSEVGRDLHWNMLATAVNGADAGQQIL